MLTIECILIRFSIIGINDKFVKNVRNNRFTRKYNSIKNAFLGEE